MKIQNLQGGYSKWSATLLSDEDRACGMASYSEKPSSELLIRLHSNELRVNITQGSFFDGGGPIFYNGKQIGNWFGKIPGIFSINDMRRITIVQLKIDDWKRRFKWAYRNGVSWKQAWQYASWGYLLIGKNYALASVINPNFGWQYGASSNPFNEDDAQIVRALPPQEQLTILFVVLRRLCSVYPGMTRSPSWIGLGHACPNVSSCVRIDKGGQSYLTLDPKKISVRNNASRWLGEFMATGHPFCWLIITVCLLAGIFVPGKGAVIGGVAFGSVTICYLILNLIIPSHNVKEILYTPSAGSNPSTGNTCK